MASTDSGVRMVVTCQSVLLVDISYGDKQGYPTTTSPPVNKTKTKLENLFFMRKMVQQIKNVQTN